MWIEHGMASRLQEVFPGEDLLEHFRVDVRDVEPSPTRLRTDFSRYFDRPMEWDEWGRGRVWDETRHYAEYFYPLQGADCAADFEEYPWTDMDHAYRYEDMRERIRKLQDAGYATLATFGETLFELAWQMRSMDALFYDMYHRPELATLLFDHITDRKAYAAARYAESGIDVVKLADDMAMQTGLMMSRETWRQWFEPRLRRVIAAAKEANPEVLIWYHSDGAITDLIPDLIGAGVEILNPIQPECVDQRQIKREFGDRLAFWGGLGVQSVLPFGTSEEVRQHVKQVIEDVGYDGGLVISPSHVVERDTPIENVIAMKEAIDQYGQYQQYQ